MTVYEINKHTVETTYEYYKGVTDDVETENGWSDTVLVEQFTSEQEATQAFQLYHSDIIECRGNNGKYYEVTEYTLNKAVYDVGAAGEPCLDYAIVLATSDKEDE